MDNLAHDLHVLTARLDVAAEQILQEAVGIGYARYRTLLGIHAMAATGGSQRDLAHQLGVTEGTVSRAVAALEADGLVQVGPGEGGGRRRQVTLGAAGEDLRRRCQAVLEGRFDRLLSAAGVDAAAYGEATRALLAALEGAGQTAAQTSGLPTGRRAS